MVDSLLNTSSQNFNNSAARFGHSSHQIATANNKSSLQEHVPLEEGLVGIKKAQQSVSVSVAVIKAEDERIGSVLDELS